MQQVRLESVQGGCGRGQPRGCCSSARKRYQEAQSNASRSWQRFPFFAMPSCEAPADADLMVLCLLLKLLRMPRLQLCLVHLTVKRSCHSALLRALASGLCDFLQTLLSAAGQNKRNCHHSVLMKEWLFLTRSRWRPQQQRQTRQVLTDVH